MKLRCPACATSYDLRPEQLAPGRQVRCARCGETWLPDLSGMDAAATSAGAVEAEAEHIPSGQEITVTPEVRTPAPAAEVPVLEQAIGFPQAHREPPRRSSAAARPAKPRRVRSGPSRMPAVAAVAAAILLIGGALIFRTSIVAAAPDLAGLYRAAGMPVNLRGLEFRNLTVRREEDGGRAVLMVSGDIENVTGREVAIPAIRLAIRADAGHEIYAWSVEPEETRVGAGASIPFRTRIDTPPPDARDVVARFADRRQVATVDVQ